MLSLSQAFEDKWKAKRASAKRSARGSMEGEPPKKAAQGPHPEEDVRNRGFDRGLQPEKVIGATDSSGELVRSGNNVIQGRGKETILTYTTMRCLTYFSVQSSDTRQTIAKAVMPVHHPH